MTVFSNEEYENLGLLTPVERSENGYRYYDEDLSDFNSFVLMDIYFRLIFTMSIDIT
jgi:hypothetical protein